jgi:glycine cleavage system pyridoxal-binding protein P
MFPSLPHTEEDLRTMLAAVGAAGLEDLFADVPSELRLRQPLAIPSSVQAGVPPPVRAGAASRTDVSASGRRCDI